MSMAPVPGGRRCPACLADVAIDNGFCGACGAEVPVSSVISDDERLIGRVIDNRYRVLRKLGQGGMGTVYLAEHVGIGKRMAIKVLRADLRDTPELVRRFRREAMAVSRLTDAHTITVFDFGVWKGLVYLVMEYLSGADLASVLDEVGRLKLPRVVAIAHQICSSLAEAHGAGIIHRDLKPDNVFLSRTAGGDEIVKVLDFGLAKMVAGNSFFDGGAPSVETQAGAILGTPYFMAPEQIRGLEVDARADIYALGALMYRMISGHYPFRGRTSMEVLEGHLNGRLAPFDEIAPEALVPRGLEGLVRRMMSRDVGERPEAALSVSEALAVVDLALTPDPSLASATHTPSELGPLPMPAHDTPWTANFGASISSAGDHGPRPVQRGHSLSLRGNSGPTTFPPDSSQGIDGPTRDEFEAYERRLRRRKRIEWTLLILLVAGALGAWLQLLHGNGALRVESEPNDSSVQANRISMGTPVQGYIGRRPHPEESDWDVFWVEIPANRGGETVDVMLTGVPGLDLVVEGQDVDGNLLFRTNDGGIGQGERRDRVPVRPPRLLLQVREYSVKDQLAGDNGTDPYNLTAVWSPGGSAGARSGNAAVE